LKESSVSGLVHISDVRSDAKRTSAAVLAQHYAVGAKVRAKVSKKDEQTRRVNLTLKAAAFDASELEAPDSDDEEERRVREEEAAERAEEGEEEGEDAAVKMEEGDDNDDDDEEGDEDEDGDDEDDDEVDAQLIAEDDDDAGAAAAVAAAAAAAERPRKKARAAAQPASPAADPSLAPSLMFGVDGEELSAAPTLALDVDASYSMLTTGGKAGAHDDDTKDEDDDEEQEEEGEEEADGADASGKLHKLSRRAKLAAKRSAEQQMRAREHSALDPSAVPESADDFERELVASPNSSLIWVKYMAHLSQLLHRRTCTHINTHSCTRAHACCLSPPFLASA
jgi:predicted RNA-binding protein with RPS1 domain